MCCSISRALAQTLRAEAAASPHAEICGLLLGSGDTVTGNISLANVAEDPATAFLLDPGGHLAASRAARLAGRAIVGCYHSHLSGDASPSLADATQTSADGFYWLIVTASETRPWRARRGGEVLGAFDPVQLQYR